MKRLSAAAVLAVLPMLAGCPSGSSTTTETAYPSFTLAWSEYPSWSVFGVAHESKLIDGAQGKMGDVEKKWGVDIVLKEAPYDSCLNMYAGGNCDAVCITNMDALNPALSRKSVAVLPTSTSVGADACLAVGIADVKGLKGKKVYGLKQSVSEYCFVRCLEKLGEDETQYEFVNLDPAVAAVNMTNKSADHEAIMVWNPFVLQTLKDRPEAKVLFDSSMIPGEIVDMVVVSDDVLKKPGGEDFANAVIDVFYELNKMLADKDKGDATLVALGDKFSRLGLEDMKKVVEQTKFYKNPDEALAVFEGSELPVTMRTVVDFCVKRQIVNMEPKIGFGTADKAPEAQLRFDSSYLHAVKAGKPAK